VTAPLTIAALVRRLTDALTPLHGEREARSLARLVVGQVTGRSGAALLRDGGEPVPEASVDKINTILRQMKEERMPVQYLLGTTSFYGLELEVTPAVLIPRPESEEMVASLFEALRDVPGPFPLLDAGTGSGCLAIALALHLPASQVWACDISEEALDIARRNARRHHADIRFFSCDLLSPGTLPDRTWQCIVSNPPYIPAGERPALQPEVALHEPPRALFVPDDDPLLFYRALAAYALHHLAEGGILMVECHEEQASHVAALFRREGMQKVRVLQDINGKSRFVKAQR